MKENFSDDNYSINSYSSKNSPYMEKDKLLKKNYDSHFSNFENNIPNNSRNVQLNHNRQRNNNLYNSPSINYNSNLDDNNIGYKRNLPINEFIPKNSTTWNKIIDFFFNW